METLRYIAISFLSGLTAIIPGVSGGTIFAIFSISERMAEDINKLVAGLFDFSNYSIKNIFNLIIFHGKVPIIIGLGSLVSSLLYAKFLVSVGHQIEFFLRFLFIGLVIFSLPTLWRESKLVGQSHVQTKNYIYVVIGFLLAIVLFNSNESLIDTQTTNYFSLSFLIKFLFFSLIAGITAILPGISGTNILIIGGVFEDYILFSSKIAEYPLQYSVYLIGTIIGSIIAAKCFTLLFKYFRAGFFSFMTGLTASTIVFIIALPSDGLQIIQAIIGFGFSYLLIKSLNEREINLKK